MENESSIFENEAAVYGHQYRAGRTLNIEKIYNLESYLNYLKMYNNRAFQVMMQRFIIDYELRRFKCYIYSPAKAGHLVLHKYDYTN